MRIEQRVLFYAMGGVFTEIIFTSLKSLYNHQDFMLHGNTQLWVTGLYAGGGLLFEQIQRRVGDARARIAFYLGMIYFLEYCAGWVLRQILGECPWHYHEPGNIHGLIQIRYAPIWLLFAGIADKLILIARTHDLVRLSN